MAWGSIACGISRRCGPRRPLLEAKAFDTLEDLEDALQHGLSLPATVAIRNAPAGTAHPIQPALGTDDRAVMCLTSSLIETIDGASNALSSRVCFVCVRGGLHTASCRHVSHTFTVAANRALRRRSAFVTRPRCTSPQRGSCGGTAPRSR